MFLGIQWPSVHNFKPERIKAGRSCRQRLAVSPCRKASFWLRLGLYLAAAVRRADGRRRRKPRSPRPARDPPRRAGGGGTERPRLPTVFAQHSAIKSQTFAPRRAQVTTAERIRSVNRSPSSLWLEKLVRRQQTGRRIACSEILLVGSTPSVSENVHIHRNDLRILSQVLAVFSTVHAAPALNSRPILALTGLSLSFNSSRLMRFSPKSFQRDQILSISLRPCAPIDWPVPPLSQMRKKCLSR